MPNVPGAGEGVSSVGQLRSEAPRPTLGDVLVQNGSLSPAVLNKPHTVEISAQNDSSNEPSGINNAQHETTTAERMFTNIQVNTLDDQSGQDTGEPSGTNRDTRWLIHPGRIWDGINSIGARMDEKARAKKVSDRDKWVNATPDIPSNSPKPIDKLMPLNERLNAGEDNWWSKIGPHKAGEAARALIRQERRDASDATRGKVGEPFLAKLDRARAMGVHEIIVPAEIGKEIPAEVLSAAALVVAAEGSFVAHNTRGKNRQRGTFGEELLNQKDVVAGELIRAAKPTVVVRELPNGEWSIRVLQVGMEGNLDINDATGDVSFDPHYDADSGRMLLGELFTTDFRVGKGEGGAMNLIGPDGFLLTPRLDRVDMNNSASMRQLVARTQDSLKIGMHELNAALVSLSSHEPFTVITDFTQQQLDNPMVRKLLAMTAVDMYVNNHVEEGEALFVGSEEGASSELYPHGTLHIEGIDDLAHVGDVEEMDTQATGPVSIDIYLPNDLLPDGKNLTAAMRLKLAREMGLTNRNGRLIDSVNFKEVPSGRAYMPDNTITKGSEVERELKDLFAEARVAERQLKDTTKQVSEQYMSDPTMLLFALFPDYADVDGSTGLAVADKRLADIKSQISQRTIRARNNGEIPNEKEIARNVLSSQLHLDTSNRADRENLYETLLNTLYPNNEEALAQVDVFAFDPRLDVKANMARVETLLPATMPFRKEILDAVRNRFPVDVNGIARQVLTEFKQGMSPEEARDVRDRLMNEARDNEEAQKLVMERFHEVAPDESFMDQLRANKLTNNQKDALAKALGFPDAETLTLLASVSKNGNSDLLRNLGLIGQPTSSNNRK